MLGELQSIRNELNGRKRIREDSGCSTENPAKKLNIQAPKINNKKEVPLEPIRPKSFILKHVFKNVSSLKVGDESKSEVFEQFGVLWRIVIVHKKRHIGLFLGCVKSLDDSNWSVEADFKMKVVGKTGNERKMEGNNFFGPRESPERKNKLWGFSHFHQMGHHDLELCHRWLIYR